MTRHFLLPVLLLVPLFGGCLMGPKYKRPQVRVPEAYRDPGTLADQTVAASLRDRKWFELFRDEKLQELIRIALKENIDLRAAATRIEQSRGLLTATRADQFPTLAANSTLTDRELSSRGGTPLPPTIARQLSYGRGIFDLAFQLDFWGRYRRLTEAARANLLAQQWGQRTIMVSLIADVAQSYFELRELDREAEIAQETLATRRESLRLTQARLNRGIASALDARQAETLVAGAAARIAGIERLRGLKENQLSLLLGRSPQDIPRGDALTAQVFPPDVPPGLPAALLERRPDIQVAEQQVIAANAQVGVAKTAFFPNFSLTGQWGYESAALGDFLSGAARTRSIPLAANIPFLDPGRIRGNHRAAKARKQEAVIEYERAILIALRESSDALLSLRNLRAQRAEQQNLVTALEDARRLSRMRYQGGVDSYLQVLDTERNLFDAQLSLAQVQRDELIAVVQLYKALGGGWE